MRSIQATLLALLTVLMIAITGISAMAQEEGASNMPWRIGGYISPDAGTLHYDFDNPYGWKTGLSAAATVEYKIIEHVHIQMGLQYAFRDSEFGLYAESLVDNSLMAFGQRDQFHYLGIPLELKGYLFKRQFSAYASLGHLLDFKLKRINSHYYTSDQAVYLLENLAPSNESNDFVFSVMGSIGLEYAIDSKSSAYFQPGIMYSYTNVCDPDAVNPNTGIARRPYKYLVYQFRLGYHFQL